MTYTRNLTQSIYNVDSLLFVDFSIFVPIYVCTDYRRGPTNIHFHEYSIFFSNHEIGDLTNMWWWSVVLVEEIGAPRENQQLSASHWQTLSHNVVSSTSYHKWGSNSQLYWWYVLIAQVDVNSTAIWARPQRPLYNGYEYHTMQFSIQYGKKYYTDNIFKYHIVNKLTAVITRNV